MRSLHELGNIRKPWGRRGCHSLLVVNVPSQHGHKPASKTKGQSLTAISSTVQIAG